MVHKLDPNTFTLRELQELTRKFEKSSAEEVFAVMEEGMTLEAMDIIAHLVCINEQKFDSSFTLDDAYDLPSSAFQQMFEDLQVDPPQLAEEKSANTAPVSPITPASG